MTTPEEKQYAQQLFDSAFAGGRPREGSRTTFGGVLDTIAPLIQEIAKLKARVDSLEKDLAP